MTYPRQLLTHKALELAVTRVVATDATARVWLLQSKTDDHSAKGLLPMTEKKNDQDDRDIFEKALDVALPVTAGVGGAMLGGKFVRAALGYRNPKTIFRELREEGLKTPRDKLKIARLQEEAKLTGIGYAYLQGGALGASGGAQASRMYLDELKKKRRKQ